MDLATLLPSRVEPLLAAFPKSDLDVLVELTVLVAYADATIDRAELEAIAATLEAIFRSSLAPMVVNTLVGSAAEQIRAVGGDAFARKLGESLRDKRVAEHGYRLALVIALSSEGISTEERYRLTLLAESAGLSAAEASTIEADVAASLAR